MLWACVETEGTLIKLVVGGEILVLLLVVGLWRVVGIVSVGVENVDMSERFDGGRFVEVAIKCPESLFDNEVWVFSYDDNDNGDNVERESCWISFLANEWFDEVIYFEFLFK